MELEATTLCGSAAAWTRYGPAIVTRGNPTQGKGPLTLRWWGGSTSIAQAADSFYALASNGDDMLAIAWSEGGAKVMLRLVYFPSGAQVELMSVAELGTGVRPCIGYLQDASGEGWCVSWADGKTLQLVGINPNGDLTWASDCPSATQMDYPAIAPAPGWGIIAWREDVANNPAGKHRLGWVLGATGDAYYSEVGWYDPSVALGKGRIWMAAHQAGRTSRMGVLDSSGAWSITDTLTGTLYPHLAYGGGVLARAYARYDGYSAKDPDALRRAVWEVSTDDGQSWRDVSPTTAYRMTHAGVAVSNDGEVLATWVDGSMAEASRAKMEVVQWKL